MRLLTSGLLLAASLSLLSCTDQATTDKIAKLEKDNQLMQDVLTMMTKGQFAMLQKDSSEAKRLHEAVKQQEKVIADQIKQDSIAASTVYTIPEDGSPAQGASNPKLTIVLFSDMQCPYCIQHAALEKEIIAKHGDQVRLVFKHFPLSFHDKSKAAHSAARAAEAQGKFFEFRYALAEEAAAQTQTQAHAPLTALSPENYIKIAQSLGLNIDKFKADMAVSTDDEARFAQDQALGQKLGVNGTPTYFINGKKAVPTLSLELVDSLLKK